jgi:hypothetical protein
VTERRPLWTPDEARAEADREGEPEESSGRKLAGCLAEGCIFDGCLALLPIACMIMGVFLWLR